MEKHQISISKKGRELKSPYGLDKYILDEFKKKIRVNKNRSQYIKYCCGFCIAEVIVIEE